MSSFLLFKDKFFRPFFFVQALGAFNDNIFKSALLIMIAYSSSDKALSDILIQISAGLFILPFFLFSAISGQVCDKYEKSALIKKIKLLEIIIMCFAFIGFITGSTIFLMVVLFFMGAQSTLFGPVKYSILPQGLSEDHLVGGNALVGMGTFLSILLGTILGGLLVTAVVLDSVGTYAVGGAIIITAVIGYLFSLKIPKLKPSDPEIKIGLNPIKETIKVLRLGLKNRKVFRGVLLISWFWFYGFFFLASLPSYCRDILMGDQLVATALLAMFSVGIGLGSIGCEKVAKGLIDLSLVIVGSFGLTLFAFDMYVVGEIGQGEIISLGQFLTSFSGLRIMFDLMMIGFFGGFYIIPLYSYIQQGSDKLIRARIISVNNILNALFMVGAAVLSIVLLKVGLSIIEIFLVVSLLNLVVFFYLIISMPDQFTKLLCLFMSKLFYRFKVSGSENIPTSGPFVIVCNHVSFIDWMLIAGVMGRPPRFLMEKEYFEIGAIGWWFRSVKAIPIASGKIDPAGYRKAFELAAKELTEGNIVAIFPEGEITKHGEFNKFRDGVLKIISNNPVTILPVALKGMWGSWFSRYSGAACKGMPSIRRRKIELIIGESVNPVGINSELLQQKVGQLLD